MDPFKDIADERTSYQSVAEQFYDDRLDRKGLSVGSNVVSLVPRLNRIQLS
jgi:hypothetical protein